MLIVSFDISENTMVKRVDKQKVDSILKKIYYNTSTEGAFLGPEKLYRVLKTRGIHNIGKNTITKWLQNQDNYSLQKPARKSFKKARVVVSGIDDMFDADLGDFARLSDQNDKVKHVLFVIDVFTKYLWVEPLKNKTAKEVVGGFKKIFNQGRICKKLRTDSGAEFISKITKNYVKSLGIYHFNALNSLTKANIAERVIQTIKNMLQRWITKHGTHRYIDVLQDIVKSYNATPHRSLNQLAPKDVNKQNEADVWAYMYLKPKKKKTNIAQYHYKTGDLIRISHKNMIFDRSYDEHFTREIFKIRQRFRMQNICMYRIQDMDGSSISGNFYESEMQKVDKDENTLWYIEKIIRKRKRNGEVQVLVKFDGFPNKFNQWLPEREIKDVVDSNE